MHHTFQSFQTNKQTDRQIDTKTLSDYRYTEVKNFLQPEKMKRKNSEHRDKILGKSNRAKT